MLLSQYAISRDNNFNLIRFLAASLVLFSHSYPIALGKGSHEPLSQLLGTSWGSIAVDIFFIASGFFIAASFHYKSSYKSFLMARILRIYPALIVTILLSTFALGLYFTTMLAGEYLSNSQTYKYLFKNITLIFGVEYYLPGVFSQNPYPNAVNGSLWTLPYEIKMYCLMVLFISLFSFIGRKCKNNALTPALVVLLTSAALITHLLNHFYAFYDGQSLKLFTMFFLGSSFFFLKNNINIRSKLGIPLILTLAISTLDKDAFFLAYTLLLPYIVFYLAYVPTGSIRHFNKLGDYSYGIYIYAFPIQQMVAALRPNGGVIEMIGLSFLGTCIMAYLSWHLIEERAIKLKLLFK
jgi:peptidoglycan/LPS O-acetylase OafA/YrhL